MRARSLALLLGVLTGCAGRSTGTAPHDMSAEEHDAQARLEESAAARHEQAYDPSATVAERRCGGGKSGLICWTSEDNPTEAHLREAERLLALAEAHRAASSELRSAEAAACSGLSATDRDVSPFDHAEDILDVEPLVLQQGLRKPAERTLGAVVTFRPVPGLTVDTLQRVVDCHLARSAAAGHLMPEMPNSPLVPKGAEARVTETDAGVAVEITSDDPDAAREIRARAERLVRERPGS